MILSREKKPGPKHGAHVGVTHRGRSLLCLLLLLAGCQPSETELQKRLADPENLETVFDYFAGQVFAAAPAAHRDMLTRMSYLPRMTAELAQAITGDADAGQLLNHLARRNLFTDRRPGDDPSYQFHALFRVFLQERARHDLGFDEHRKLTNSAAALLQATGQVEDAFALYAEAAEWEPATRLILKEADRLVRQGRRQTLRQWIQSLPMDRFEPEPWLAYWYAVSHLGADYRVAEEQLERAYRGFEATDDWKGMTLTTCRAVDLRFAVIPPGTNEQRWYRRLELLVEKPRTDVVDEPVYGEALVKLLQSLIASRPFTRDFSAAASRVEALLETCDDDLRLTAISRLMVHWIHQGDRQRVQQLYGLGAEMIASGAVTPAAALWWYQPAVLHHLYIADAATARRLSEAAKILVDDSGCVPNILEFDRLLAVTRAFTDGVESGDRYLRQMVVPHLQMATGFTQAYTYLLLSAFALAQDQPEEALAASLDGLAIARGRGERSLSMRYLLVVHAAALGANGRHEEAWLTLDAVTEGTDDGHNGEVVAWRRQVEIDLLLRQGRCAEAHARIREHIAALSTGRYERTAAHSSKIYARIYAEALEAGIEPEFAKRMIRKWRYPPPPSAGPEWPWPVRIRALDGESVPRQSGGRAASRVLDLLKTTVALGGNDVPCTALADTVWPESDGAAAMRAFEVTLFRLRKRLGREDAILVRDGRLSLNPECCWWDSRAFEQCAEAIDRVTETDASLDAALARAIGFYRGHLLAGEDEHPGLLAARDRLRSRWLSLVRRQVARYVSRSDWRTLAQACREALAIDPTPEDLLRQLMDSLDRQGQRSEALNVYRLGAEQLRLSVGWRPAPETEALARTLERR